MVRHLPDPLNGANLRAEMASSGNRCQSSTRLGRDGRTYNTAGVQATAGVQSHADAIWRAVGVLCDVKFREGMELIDYMTAHPEHLPVLKQAKDFLGELAAELEAAEKKG